MADHSMFKPTKPHFMKIVTEGTLQDRKLMIPRNFVRKYGNGLFSSPEVVLMVPDGARWPVGVTVTESDGNVWFQNGWQDFVEYYSLRPLQVLIFRYKGSFKFKLLILDQSSALEIEYPFRQNQKQKAHVEVTTDEEQQEANGSSSESYEEEEANGIIEEFDSDENSSQSDESWCSEESEDETRFGFDESQSPPKAKMQRTSSTDKATARDRAYAFESENPFFVLEMQPSYLKYMTLPSKFLKQHLKEKSGHLTLCTSDGQTWSAKYLQYGKNNKYQRSEIGKGWNEFRLDNKLEPGDVCVFELIDQTKIMFKIIIYRATHDSNHHSSFDGRSSGKKAIAFERASSFRSTNPFFKVFIHPSYLRGTGKASFVHVPCNFSKTYLDGKDQVILQVSDGRSWILKHCFSTAFGQPRAKFYHDWSAFVQANKVKIGDVCLFELINCAEALFKVSIF